MSDWEAFRHARADDPWTSKEAAASLSGRETLMNRLLDVFLGCPGGMTAEEAADGAGLDRWQTSKRVSDLLSAEMLVDSGRVRAGRSGRSQRVLVPAPEFL